MSHWLQTSMVIHCPVIWAGWQACLISVPWSLRQGVPTRAWSTYILCDYGRGFWPIVFLPPLRPPFTDSSLSPVIQIFPCSGVESFTFSYFYLFSVSVISSRLVELLSVCKIFLIYICSLDHSFESQIHPSTILPKLYLNLSKCLSLPLLKPGF